MRLLGIESSCDETAAAIIESSPDNTSVKLLSHSLATSLAQHAKTGGIIPEMAARAQIQYILPVIAEAWEKGHIDWNRHTSPDIDGIAVTYGPGLIGSLLVGVETAKVLSYVWNKPLIQVNHLFGHIYANWIDTSSLRANETSEAISTFQPPSFPAIILVVSGGHTDLLLMKSHTDITWLGGTRDDAAGEAFDKIGRFLGFSYPAGPKIEKSAEMGNPNAYHFPRPLYSDESFDFSFSGLKTAILREVEKQPDSLDSQTTNNIARGVQDAIIDVLTKKTILAAQKYNASSIVLSGGVAANQTLRDGFMNKLTQQKSQHISFFVPPKYLCTDNAAMIAAAGFFRPNVIDWQSLRANPQLYFD